MRKKIKSVIRAKNKGTILKLHKKKKKRREGEVKNERETDKWILFEI